MSTTESQESMKHTAAIGQEVGSGASTVTKVAGEGMLGYGALQPAAHTSRSTRSSPSPGDSGSACAATLTQEGPCVKYFMLHQGNPSELYQDVQEWRCRLCRGCCQH